MSALNQICFTDETNCVKFSGHKLKPNMCINCMKDIAKHNEKTVNEEDLMKALESTQKGERVPSVILEKDEKGYGKLFLGGFKTVLNEDFIKMEKLGGIVNTVGDGLFTLFGAKLEKTYREKISSHDLECLFLQWEDSLNYNISDEDLEKALRHIHDIRKNGRAVLVHCAQGKSRSSTAVIAYVMTVKSMSLKDSYDFVKERRKMAEPNAHFMYFLSKFENSEMISKLREELV